MTGARSLNFHMRDKRFSTGANGHCDEYIVMVYMTLGEYTYWRIIHFFFLSFIENSKVEIGRSRLDGHRCDGGLEASPAGYSNVSIECLKGCARNYRCHFGDHSLLFNNCHFFANRLSSVLCTSKEGLCPTWCLKSCDDATDYSTEGVWRPIFCLYLI